MPAISPASPFALESDERSYQQTIVDLARQLGWRVAHFRPAKTSKGWRTPVAADGAGWPDLILVRDRLVVIEVKTEKGHLRPEQAMWLQLLLDAGTEVYLARPSLLDEIAAVLATRGRPRPVPLSLIDALALELARRPA